MSRWAPCKRRVFIRRLRKLGFDGPYSGTRHQFMVYGRHRMSIPSNAEYSVPQLRMMLKSRGLSSVPSLLMNGAARDNQAMTSSTLWLGSLCS